MPHALSMVESFSTNSIASEEFDLDIWHFGTSLDHSLPKSG